MPTCLRSSRSAWAPLTAIGDERGTPGRPTSSVLHDGDERIVPPASLGEAGERADDDQGVRCSVREIGKTARGEGRRPALVVDGNLAAEGEELHVRSRVLGADTHGRRTRVAGEGAQGAGDHARGYCDEVAAETGNEAEI